MDLSNLPLDFQVHATNATLPNTFTEEQIQGVIDANPVGIAKAWVNFDGTGTVAIRDSFNVSSITDNGTGAYTVNFTTPMANANYTAVATSQYDNTNATTTGGSGIFVEHARTQSSAAQCHLICSLYNGVLFDMKTVSVAVFGS